jgi:hypothetical protein
MKKRDPSQILPRIGWSWRLFAKTAQSDRSGIVDPSQKSAQDKDLEIVVSSQKRLVVWCYSKNNSQQTLINTGLIQNR